MNNIEQIKTDQNTQSPLPEKQAQYFDQDDKNDLLLNNKEITPNEQNQNDYLDKVCKLQNQYRKYKQMKSSKVINIINIHIYTHIGKSFVKINSF